MRCAQNVAGLFRPLEAGRKDMKRILVPIDGSTYSMKALQYLAKRRQSGDRFEVVVVNVQQNVRPSRLVSRAMIEDWQQSQAADVLSTPGIRALARKLKAEIQVLIGDPAATIITAAKDSKCAEIVMATRGMGAIKGIFMGSVASKIVQLSPLPVTLVK
jgi:nucleotide-binding universal stress UspA family protein